MEKPFVENEKLKQMVDTLYRDNAQVGSGSTADAVRYELATGQTVKGKWHTQKAKDSIKALDSWLSNNPTASSGDRAVAEIYQRI